LTHPACPTCHERIWRYQDTTWTCRHGHHTQVDGDPPTATPVPSRLQRALIPAATVATSVTLATLIDHLT
jgi:hypothetical protein